MKCYWLWWIVWAWALSFMSHFLSTLFKPLTKSLGIRRVFSINGNNGMNGERLYTLHYFLNFFLKLSCVFPSPSFHYCLVQRFWGDGGLSNNLLQMYYKSFVYCVEDCWPPDKGRHANYFCPLTVAVRECMDHAVETDVSKQLFKHDLVRL